MKYTTIITLFIVALLHVWPSASQNTTVYELELCYVESFTCDNLQCDDLPEREFCSCLRSCTIFGDCCYGVEEYHQKCPESDAIQNRQKDIDFKNLECIESEYFLQSYMMVAKCPNWWREVDRCRSNGTQTYGRFEDGQLEAIPVISLKTGVSYKNLFCALCNSESLDDLRPWRILAECSPAQKLKLRSMNVSDSINYMLSRCNDARLAPQADYIRQSLYFFPCYGSSFENMTDRCPTNYIDGNFTTFNVSRLCEEIYAPLVVNNQLFKNQYCAECHFATRPYQEVSFFKCDQYERGFPFVRGVSPLLGGITFSPISVTLTFSQSDGTKVISCKTGEIYDIIAQTCIHLNCQDGYYFNGKECLSTADRNKIPCNYTVSTATVRLSNDSLTVCDVKLGACWSKCLLDILGLNHEDIEYLTTSTDVDEAGRIVVAVNFSVLLVIMQQYENVWFKGDFKIPDNSENCKRIENIDIVASCQSFEKHLCFSDWMTSDHFFVYTGGTDGDIFGVLMENENVQNFSLSEVKVRYTIHFSKVTEGVIHNRLYQVASSHNYPCKDLFCETIIVNASSFVSVMEGSMTLVHVSDPSVRLTPDQYKYLGDGNIEVCNFYQEYHTTLDAIKEIIYITGTSLSVFALAFCVITYATFPQLRTSVSKVLTMVLCINLLVASLSFMMVSWAKISQIWCTGVAWAIHFFFLTTFATSSIIGFHFMRTFGFKPRSSQTTSRLSGSNIVASLAGCYGVPCGISLTLVFCHVIIQNDRIRYGDETICLIGDEYVNLWAFIIPAGTSVAFNIFAFIFVTLSIYIQTKGKKSLVKGKKRTDELKTFFVFFKISSLLGLTWLIGFLGILTKQSFILFIFDLLTPFQGFLIFVSFMCKRETWKLWKQQLKGKVRPQNATSTSKATSRTTPVTQRTTSGRIGATVSNTQNLQAPYTIRGDSRDILSTTGSKVENTEFLKRFPADGNIVVPGTYLFVLESTKDWSIAAFSVHVAYRSLVHTTYRENVVCDYSLATRKMSMEAKKYREWEKPTCRTPTQVTAF